MTVGTIVAWNINQCRKDVWPALDELDPDITLLTEAVIPDARRGVSFGRTEGLDQKSRPWSAAVVTTHPFTEPDHARPVFRGHPRPVAVRSARPGAWAVARVDVPVLGLTTAISLYGLLDDISDTSMHRSISEVSPMIDDPDLGHMVVLGGDFNTGTQWKPRESRWQRRDVNVLDRLSALGLVDLIDRHRADGPLEGCPCTFGPNCRHARTRRDPRRPSIPYQTDYLFASRALAERLTKCEVFADDDWFALSDHAPIVATFEA